MKKDLYTNIVRDLSYSLKRTINEAFDFGSVKNNSSAAQRVSADILNAAYQELAKETLAKISNNTPEQDGKQWRSSNSAYNFIIEPISHTNYSLDISPKWGDMSIKSKELLSYIKVANEFGIIINKFTLNGYRRKHLFVLFSIGEFFEMFSYSLPDLIIFNDAEGNQKEAICVIVNDDTANLADNDIEKFEYLQEHFADMIFIGFEGENQTFINENIYQLGIENPQAYLKSKKLKCEAKDLQRVEDLLKKQKNCESMAKAIGEKAMSKAGSRFVASLRLLDLPVPPFDDDTEAKEELMNFYRDFTTTINYPGGNRKAGDTINKLIILKPAYFAEKYLELGGTMEDIFAMYDASYGDGVNPDTITARQQKINSFSKATTAKYGRLKDFVVFLDSLNIPYSVDPINATISGSWGSKQEWQGVTLFDDDDPNTAHFAITSSEGMTRGNGDRVGSYRVGGGWTRYGYRSEYRAEYAHNGNWRMEGELLITKISDNLLPFIKEGPVNLTQLRNAIKKFLKSIQQ